MKGFDYTVIINILNGEAFVLQALREVQCQSVQPKRIVAVNNGSSDRTLDILHIAAKADDRINILSIEDTVPLYKARNVGLQRVCTRYVAFLDVDDLWERHKCEKQIERMKDLHGVIVCTTNHAVVLSSSLQQKRVKEFVATKISPRNIIRDYNVHFSSVMLDLENICTDNRGGLFCNEMTILGDLDFFALFCNENNWVNISQPLTGYVYHGKNTGYRKYYRLIFESLMLSFRLMKAGKRKAGLDAIPYFLEKTLKSYIVRIIRAESSD